MVVLFDGVSDALESGRRMIKLTRDFDPERGMSRDGIIINCDSAIGRDELSGFSHHQRINLQRARLDTARGNEQFSDRLIQLLRIVR
jgi:hypothetical protein